MCEIKRYLLDRLKVECYKRKIDKDIDEELLDIILTAMLDAELYDMLLRLDC